MDVVTKAKQLAEELEGLGQRLSTLTDRAEREKAEAELKAKTEQYQALRPALEALARAKEIKVQAKTAEEMTAVEPAGKDMREPAQARDPRAEEREHVKALTDYIQGRAVSDRAIDAFGAPSGGSWKNARGGLRIPRSMTARWWERVAGKAIPMLSTDTTQSALVGTQTMPELLRLSSEAGTILSLVRIVPVDGFSTIYWPALRQTDDGGEFGSVAVGWTSEGNSKPETEPIFDQVAITCYELSAYTEASQTLLGRSVIDLEALISELFADAARSALDTAILIGSGSGQPLGVTSAPIREVQRENAGTVVYADLVRLRHAIRSYHREACRYVYHDSVGQALELATDEVGRPLFTASAANGPYDLLLGHRHQATYALPEVGEDGDIVFGDWTQYILAIEQDVVIRRSEHYQFRKNLVAFAAYMLAGGRPASTRAFAQLVETTSTAAS